MVAEVLVGLGAIKSAFDIAKGLKDIDDAARRNAAVIELQEKILSAQQAQADLVEDIRRLEKQVADFETWERQKKRYQLHKLPPGTFVMILKNGMEEGEPSHYACAKCFEHRKRSVLNNLGTQNGITSWMCHECLTTFNSGQPSWYEPDEPGKPGRGKPWPTRLD